MYETKKNEPESEDSIVEEDEGTED
jgi:hypothetical protein